MRFTSLPIVLAFSAAVQAQFAIPLISYIVATGVSSDLMRGAAQTYTGGIVIGTTLFVQSNFVISYLEGAVNTAKTQGALLPIDSSLVTSSLTTTQSQLIGMLSALNSVYRNFVNSGNAPVMVVQLNRIRDLSQQLGTALLPKVGTGNQGPVNAWTVTIASSITNTVTLLSQPRRENATVEAEEAPVKTEKEETVAKGSRRLMMA